MVPIPDRADLHRFLLAYITDSTLVAAANKPHFAADYRASMLFSLDHSIHFHDHDYKVDEWLLYENFSNVASKYTYYLMTYNDRIISIGLLQKMEELSPKDVCGPGMGG